MTILPAKRSLIWVMILLQALISSNHFCIGESTSPIIVNNKEAPPKNKQEVEKIKGEVSQLLLLYSYFSKYSFKSCYHVFLFMLTIFTPLLHEHNVGSNIR